MNTTSTDPTVNRRILLVDDNAAIHEDFKKIFIGPIEPTDFDVLDKSFFGAGAVAPPTRRFEIDSASQGQEAIELIEQALLQGRPYAMAFVDVRMPPGLDGIETIVRMWRIYPDLQVVLCTAFSDYSWDEMIAKVGESDRLVILKKPFDNIEALQLASALCEKWKLTQEARHRLADTERIVEARTHDLRESNLRLQIEIEQRKEAEAHLLRAQRLEGIGTLASGIAHDLNNILSPILMSAELLRLNLPEESHDLLSMIESSAERGAQVVRQVLTFARGIEGDRLPLQPKQLIREMEKIIAATFPPLVRFESRIASGLSLIEGDSTQLHQVLLNLCVNARDAMPDGGALCVEADDFEVDEHYASMKTGARASRYVRLRVSDTGSGVPRHLIEKIFDPFFTTKPHGSGTGLGLSTVVGIVKSHQGFLNVRSEMGKGTTFEVFLPAADGGVPSVEREQDALSPTGHGELILVVDDESTIRSLTESLLIQNGYRTLVAADGAEALSMFAGQHGRIDVVFTDVMMPLLDGVALCRALQKLEPEVRIVAATGSGDEGRLRELRSLNIGAVLAKPFTTRFLLAAIDEVLAPTGCRGALSHEHLGVVAVGC